MFDTHVGGNESCPCGSGKKFKQCCLFGNALPELRTVPTDLVQKGRNNNARPRRCQTPTPHPIPPGAVEQHDDRVIRSTAEHPFYVYNKGWTPLCELKSGDWIRTDNGWVEVSGVEDTGKYETVYNCRVADYHTYFVGGSDWGFAVWAHNACNGGNVTKKDVNTATKILTQFERLAEKLGVKLSDKRISELNRLRDAGTISSNHMPATLLEKFPGQLKGLSLSEIAKLLRG